MTFNEFTDRIKAIFRNWNTVLIEDSIKLSIPELEGNYFILNEKEFNQLHEKITTNSSENALEIHVDNYYEVLLQSDSYRYEVTDDYNEYHDEISKIKYRHGAVSNNLAFAILYNSDIDELRSLLRRPMMFLRMRINESFQNQEHSLLEFISKYLLRRYSSLVIESEGKFSLSKAQSYMYAYVYTYVYNRQISIYPSFDINSLFPQRRYRKRADDFDYPKKTYIQELISYYNEAISSTILSHKYLSFYHILEYFYENVFLEDQITKARELITDVGFSHKRNKDIARLINLVQNKAIDKDIAINEKTALALLIQKHVPQELLKEKLVDRYGLEFLEVLKHKVEFSSGKIIIFTDADEKQYIETLTNRIYKTRNAIVHSKESFTDDKKNNKYKPIKDDKELSSEIALIQVVAEIIINDTAKEI